MFLVKLAFISSTVKLYNVEENHSLSVEVDYTIVSVLAHDASDPVHEADFLRRSPK